MSEAKDKNLQCLSQQLAGKQCHSVICNPNSTGTLKHHHNYTIPITIPIPWSMNLKLDLRAKCLNAHNDTPLKDQY